MTARFIALALVGLLAGCASQLPINGVTPVASKLPGAVGSDVYAGRRAAGEEVPTFAGEQMVVVRTYAGQVTSSGGVTKGNEMSGAACRLEASGFEADVTTPAKVRVPLYREASSPLSVSCAHEGFQQQHQTYAVFNKSRSERASMVSSGAGAGLIGVAVGALAYGIAEAASDPKQDVYHYGNIAMVMAPTGAAAKRPTAKPSSPAFGEDRLGSTFSTAREPVPPWRSTSIGQSSGQSTGTCGAA